MSAPRNPLLPLTFVDALGTGAFTASGVVVFTRLLHLTSASVTSGLAIASLCAAAMLVPVGKLLEGRSLRSTMTWLNGVLAAVVPLLLLRGGVIPFTVLIAGILLLERGVSAVRGAALGRMSEQRVKASARNRAAANLGFAIGGGVAAAAIGAGSRGALVSLVFVDAVSFLACALLARGLPHDRQPRTGPVYSMSSLTDPRYVIACAANMIGNLHNSLLFVALPLWIARELPHALFLVPLVTVVNTGLVVILQQRLARGADGLRASLAMQSVAGFVMLIACALMTISARVSSARRIGLVAVATLLLTVAEMRQSAASWDIAFTLTPQGRMTEYQALFGLSSVLEQVLGPVLTGLVILRMADGFGWLVVGLGVSVTLTICSLLVRLQPKTPSDRVGERPGAGQDTDVVLVGHVDGDTNLDSTED